MAIFYLLDSWIESSRVLQLEKNKRMIVAELQLSSGLGGLQYHDHHDHVIHVSTGHVSTGFSAFALKHCLNPFHSLRQLLMFPFLVFIHSSSILYSALHASTFLLGVAAVDVVGLQVAHISLDMTMGGRSGRSLQGDQDRATRRSEPPTRQGTCGRSWQHIDSNKSSLI